MKNIVLFLLFTITLAPLGAQTYSGTTGPISDDGVTNVFTSTVAGLSPTTIDTAHGVLNVCLDITHTYDSDLDVQLESPDGTTVLLFSGIGGGDDNFTGTCLSDDAGTTITSGTAPFTGTFIPMDILGNMNNGQNGNGLWKLKITDTYGADAGTLLSWSITFANHVNGPFVMDSTNLPLILINTNGATIIDGNKITAGMKIIANAGSQYNHVTDAPNVYNGPIGIEIRGASSSSYPQKPYGIETRDSLGNNLNVSLLGMPAENDWILQAVYNDKVFMRNTLAFRISAQMGHYAPRTRFCEVMINGSYKGIYILTEKIKRDEVRVDISKLESDDNAGDSLTGGYIIKLDYYDASNSWLSNFHPLDHPALDVYYVYEYPDPDTITVSQKTYIQGFMNMLETALYSPTFTDPQTGYRRWLGVSSFIDYLLVNEVSRNNDGFKKSLVMYKNRDSHSATLKTGPVWDFDWAWKNVNECPIFSATDGSGWSYMINDCSPDNNSNGWTFRLLEDSTFANQVHCRWLTLRQHILDTAFLFQYIDSVHTVVEEAQQRHYQKWPILGINVGTPEVDAQPNSYDGEVQKFKHWIRTRLTWLDANMPGECPNFGGTEIPATALLQVFPNPATDVVFIESDRLMNQVELFNLTGEKVFSTSDITRHAIDLKVYPDGIYLLNVLFNNGERRTEKIIKAGQ
jgi:subtilisin-like proprotein convertase family protein